MNLILMRTKVDHSNGWWEPDATSTPLKKFPPQLEVKNKAQKQGRLTKNNFVDSKKSRRKRPNTYFDPSSSDESDEIKRRPIIKLSSKENSTKVLLKGKKSAEEENDTVIIGQSRNFHKDFCDKNGVTAKKNISVVENTKNLNKKVQNKKKMSQTKADLYPNSDEENIKKDKKNKTYLNRTVKEINYSRDEHSRHPSDFNEMERKKLQKVSKANKLPLKPEKVKIKSNKNSKVLRSYQKISTGKNKLAKLPKTSKNLTTGANFFNNQTENSAAKNDTTESHKPMVNTANPLNLKKEFNLSHQLFSESTEQEYLKILDLTTDEDNEAKESTAYSLQRGGISIHQPFLWPYNNSYKDCNEIKDEERQKNKKQISEKYWILRDQATEFPAITTEKEAKYVENLPKNNNDIQNVKFLPNAEEICKGKNTENNYTIKNCVFRNQNDQNDNKEQEFYHRNVTENETLASYKNERVTKGTLYPSPEMDVNIQEKSEINSSEKSVFKKFDELSFNKNEFGCSAVECWNVSNVKCGVFKLKIKSRFACQTLHSNTHLGGVLVKGHLKMKIGFKEQDLKEGDMVFVPPLTEWEATNIGECESVFYYWCGRFGKKP